MQDPRLVIVIVVRSRRRHCYKFYNVENITFLCALYVACFCVFFWIVRILWAECWIAGVVVRLVCTGVALVPKQRVVRTWIGDVIAANSCDVLVSFVIVGDVASSDVCESLVRLYKDYVSTYPSIEALSFAHYFHWRFYWRTSRISRESFDMSTIKPNAICQKNLLTFSLMALLITPEFLHKSISS